MLAIVVLVTLVACNGGTAEPSSASGAFSERVEKAITEAKASDASDAQIALLERARASGVLSVEDLRTAAHATVHCLQEQGIEASYFEDASQAGVVRPNYRARVEERASSEELIQACDEREFSWANYLYYFQDSSVEQNEQYVQTRLPALHACLADSNHPMPADATVAELLAEAAIVVQETTGGTNCFLEAGLDTV